MTADVIDLSEFNLDSLYNTFNIGRENAAARMIVSQIYRDSLSKQKGDTAEERRRSALQDTEKRINWNYPIFNSYYEDFTQTRPDLNMNALRIAVMLDGCGRNERTFLPEDIRQDVMDVLEEAEGVYKRGPSELGYRREETALLVHVRMMAELNDGEQILVDQDADDLCYLVGTSLYAFKKIVKTEMKIGSVIYDRIDKMEDTGVAILKDHPDVPKITISHLMLVPPSSPRPEVAPSL